jgi:hypothetical protein
VPESDAGFDSVRTGARVLQRISIFVNKYQLVSLLWLLSSLNGQTLVDLRTQTKNVDFSNAASTVPAKSGTALPASCNPGEMFFRTSNAPGQNLYGCEPANTWTLLSGGSSNGTVSTATGGQFGFYSASGSTIVGHTLVPGDIPALNYQAPLAFTGNGAKTATSTGAFIGNDCAKWDASGNIVDSGAPCAVVNVGNGTAGQFGFYAANGNAITAHTLAANDIPPLNYQGTLTFTGNGTKTASATGVFTSNDCAKWDANGNVIDAGSPCASVATGAAGQFGFYSASGNALTAHTLAASDIPLLNYQAPLTFTGNGARTASSTGSITANDCAKWDASGNIIDSGAPCGSGSGGGLAAPASTTVGNVPQYSNTTGTALSIGLGVVTVLGTPGSDSNIPTERSVRTAIAAASTAAGNLPAQTGVAGYLYTDGSAASWRNIVTGGSGALDCVSIPGVCDVATAVVPLKGSANVMTGVNKFSQLQVSLYTVAALPACNASFEGQMEGVTDAASATYLATVTGGGNIHVPVYCNGTSWVAH